jgi:membrane protease YdiL (CAAX protease family)
MRSRVTKPNEQIGNTGVIGCDRRDRDYHGHGCHRLFSFQRFATISTGRTVLVWTTLAFTLWHVSAISLETGFDVPANEIPVYLVNATLIGAVFGTLQMATGSIVVPSVCHAVWNGIDYPIFGFGEKSGALGIEQTHVYGPEVGLLGLVLNTLFLVALWFWLNRFNRPFQSGGANRLQ